MAALPGFGNYLSHPDGALDVALDQSLGRHLKPTPAHLSRIIHVPEHQDVTSHLPLYDITETYAKAVKTEFIGSNKYRLRLAMIKRQNGDGTGADVRYLVNFESRSSKTDVTVERRVLGRNGEIVKMYVLCKAGKMHLSWLQGLRHCRHLPREGDRGFHLTSLNTAQAIELFVATSFPVPDSKMYMGAIPVRHPWFTISHTLPDGAVTVPSNLEWQVLPKELGTLRYTLVDTAEVAENGEPVIHAVYHHVGIACGLPSEYSEGVLLLSGNLNGEAEALAVATLLGLLRQVRSINQPPPRPSKKSFVKRVLGKI
ncbi:uncharacterized protein GLRG_01894 [Colletotrichum graminicola M1.001]|uniref:Uncharacterized protein n=1 Tax=Colletotrichum graminicola (strain M1.001 / M2 / FGSC 10212) TaxID=645133 RepID=E3Q8N5_COLGM|nr:uncharacterized protein GLRG_01894 [Colletotrichum graminicola M1.001]EFQ27399.1 hypothetical protein GLRG_01894 [Colletotrichum graminicola M1.001]